MLNDIDEAPVAHELSEQQIRAQLDLLVNDVVFRSSKRSVEFLKYVVDQTLKGRSAQIKERTIGVEVFGRTPAYDTNDDHVVRTAAIELRKRLAIYYGEEKHRSEPRMSLVPGSYVPRFTRPLPRSPHEPEAIVATPVETAPKLPDAEPWKGSGDGFPASAPTPAAGLEGAAYKAEAKSARLRGLTVLCGVLLIFATVCGFWYLRAPAKVGAGSFWQPLIDEPGSVLLAVGDVPSGPPTPGTTVGERDTPLPTLQRTSSLTLPFADMVTIAKVMGTLNSQGKKVIIRRESASSFSDLRQGPAVLIGAFNNEWSLRLTSNLRFTLALDPEKHLIYIRDRQSPQERTWSWATDQPKDQKSGGAAVQDFALISRVWNSNTGHLVIIIGGLYTYGTQSAGEFLTDPEFARAVAQAAPLDDAHRNLQIVLATTVTDETPGPPRIVAVSIE